MKIGPLTSSMYPEDCAAAFGGMLGVVHLNPKPSTVIIWLLQEPESRG